MNSSFTNYGKSKRKNQTTVLPCPERENGKKAFDKRRTLSGGLMRLEHSWRDELQQN